MVRKIPTKSLSNGKISSGILVVSLGGDPGGFGGSPGGLRGGPGGLGRDSRAC